jgi:hypothetical protein
MKGYKSVGASGYGKAAPSKNKRKTKIKFYNSSQERREQKDELIKKYCQGQALSKK